MSISVFSFHSIYRKSKKQNKLILHDILLQLNDCAALFSDKCWHAEMSAL